MIPINDALLDNLVREARASERKRKNYNFHKHPSDNLQRMLNALEPGSYVQPHKHESPDKREAFIILRGEAVVVEFDDEGEITESHILSNKTGNYGVEVAPRTWHAIYALQSGTVVYELKDGPYNPRNDKVFAPWAPREGDAEAEGYMSKLIHTLGRG